jgi:hypothetical protein
MHTQYKKEKQKSVDPKARPPKSLRLCELGFSEIDFNSRWFWRVDDQLDYVLCELSFFCCFG